MPTFIGNNEQGEAEAMPIQFRCNKCQDWIEVDYEHAGAKAICPFCQVVNTVPRESEEPIAARPFQDPHSGVPAESPATKRLTRIGMISLLMAILSIVFMAIPTVVALSHLPASLQQQVWQHTPADPEAFRQLHKQVMEETSAFLEVHSWLAALGSLGLFLWLVSLAMSISVIFRAGMHRRTYAWAGLVVNTFLLFACLCSGMMQRLAGS
jgi:hypothetical protein